MRRPWHIWLAFGLCFAVVLAAMGLVSVIALRLDRAEGESRRRAALEENVRLALWRMDSALAPLIAQENGRPYFAYTPFYPAERAYTRMFNTIDFGEVLVPSTLLTEVSPWVLLHFQFGPDGALTSPQVPTANMRDLAETGYTTHEAIEASAARLATFTRLVERGALAQALPLSRAPTTRLARLRNPRPAPNQQAFNLPQRFSQVQPQAVQQAQAERDASEFQMRFQRKQEVEQPPANTLVSSDANVSAGTMKAVWLRRGAGEALVLARRVVVGEREYVQGCWLDWPALRGRLLDEIADLLPAARLEPAEHPAADPGRLLAALPLRVVPGDVNLESSAPWSPIRVSLLIAWACVLLAATAVAVLLTGTLSLSERRGAFVSAVTHELRTPLTTFRLYAEMLGAGMVADAAQRAKYLETLQVEADRLGHLVENVLAYARLERGRATTRLDDVSMRSLVEGVRKRLTDRAALAGMDLAVEADESALAAMVRSDPAAVEQILFNLVDNACKYAASAADRRIHVRVEPRGDGPVDAARGSVAVCVCDHGPGIGRQEGRRLFRPFSKSAREAAGTAPGVGLGLALSRRLARAMGGDLSLRPDAGTGACFVLHLPAAGASG
jgi:signal transduction histidine kinase